MATQNNDTRTFQANAAMSAYRLVAISSNGGVGLNPATKAGDGVLQEDVKDGDAKGAVVRMPGAGSFKVAITGAVTAGNLLFAEASGYAAASGTIAINLRAAESASGTNSVIEAIPVFAAVNGA